MGQRFGMLTVISDAGTSKGKNQQKSKWLCKCDCGAEKIVIGSFLRRGITKTCGKHMRRVDLTGQRFGKLKVIKFIEMKGRSVAQYECLCDCGNATVASGNQLQQGRKKSCGCLARHYRAQGLTHKEGHRIGFSKQGAKHKGFSWELSDLEAANIIRQPCYICGLTPHKDGLNGIDRFDNSKGYTVENSRPCCWACNDEKSDISLKMILRLAELIKTEKESLNIGYFSRRTNGLNRAYIVENGG